MSERVLPIQEAGTWLGKKSYGAAWKFFRRARFRLVRLGKRGIGVRERDLLAYIKNTEDPRAGRDL